MDSGNLSDMVAKLDTLTAVMSQLDYDAVGLGNADVRLGDEFIKKATANKLRVLDISPAANKSTVPYYIKTVDGVRIGIISFGALPLDAKVSDFNLRKIRIQAYKEARSKSDVLILLDQSNTATDEWLQRNAERLGAPDIVIGGVQRTSPKLDTIIGKTHVVSSMPQGKELGVIDLEFTSGQALKLTVNKVSLDEKYPQDEQVAERVGKAIVAMSGTAQIVQGIQSSDRTSSKPYYSPLLCKACHAKQYDDWAKTGHAKALKALVVSKNTTPDCLPCHSEIYRQTQKYIATDNTYAGVECATCHMNSLPHGLEHRNSTQHAKVDTKLCVECHTKDRSPTYDEKTYLPMVAHAVNISVETASKPALKK